MTYTFADFESETVTTSGVIADPDKHILSIGRTDPDEDSPYAEGEEVAVIVHRTADGRHPLDGVTAEAKRERARRLCDILNGFRKPANTNLLPDQEIADAYNALDAVRRAGQIDYQRIGTDSVVARLTVSVDLDGGRHTARVSLLYIEPSAAHPDLVEPGSEQEQGWWAVRHVTAARGAEEPPQGICDSLASIAPSWANNRGVRPGGDQAEQGRDMTPRQTREAIEVIINGLLDDTAVEQAAQNHCGSLGLSARARGRVQRLTAQVASEIRDGSRDTVHTVADEHAADLD